MNAVVLARLGGIVAVVVVGWIAARTRVLGGPQDDGASARVLSNLAFTILTPALLFRTTAHVDLATLPWVTLAGFFAPALVVLLTAYGLARWLGRTRDTPAAPAVRAMSVTFGNTVQVGLPVVVALYGAEGLRLHIAIVSLHALTILTVITAVVEADLTRAARASRSEGEAVGHPLQAVATTARNTVIHPVVLPVLAGLVWNLTGVPLPAAVDDVLELLGQGVVPVCLVLIGVSLHQYGDRAALAPAALLGAAKLMVLPAAVLAVSSGLFGVRGVALHVAVLAAAAPVGSNALLFAQRYRTLEGETSTAIVVSTAAYALTLPVWLVVLATLP